MKRLCNLTCMFLFSVILSACAVRRGGESTGEYLDSSVITAKVKASLVDGLGAKGFSIKVKTYKDEVQLSGFVASQLTKDRAGIITSRVEGVRQISNDIIVK